MKTPGLQSPESRHKIQSRPELYPHGVFEETTDPLLLPVGLTFDPLLRCEDECEDYHQVLVLV